MRYLSVCSGIEAATVAWHPLGWSPAAFSEIEAFPRAVLQHHYPDVPLHGDFTTIKGDEYGPIDLLVGGTPCQSFSVAGLRGGLADDRGNLALQFLKLADRARPRWVVWENVPGVLSSHGGRDFGSILGGLVELGYGFAYRVLDAQHFGVPQRRRRVFVVGHLGDWRRAAAVLFERHSLSGHPAPRRQTGEGITASPGGIAGTCSSKWSKGSGGPAGDEHYNLIAHSLRAEGFDASGDGTGRETPLVPVTHPALTCHASNRAGQTLAQDGALIPVCFTAKDYGADASDISPTLRAGGHSKSHANAGVMPAVMLGSDHASSPEIHATSLLHLLREQIGEEAFTQWGSGVAYSFQSPEILRPEVHGSGLRCEADEAGCGLDDGPLPRQARSASGAMRGLWKAGCERRPPQGRELPQQLARELGAALSELSHETASAKAFLLGLRRAGEGLGLLQSALPPAQGRPTTAVRRLTPLECERLMGLPDHYTAVPYRGKQAADGPRYKALGNSMAVPVMRFIGERIRMVEALSIARAA